MNDLPKTAAPVVDAASLAALTRCSARAALFLDRDGVVNVDHGYVHTEQGTEWVPGVFDLAAAANAAGMVVIVITNQAGIARGFYDESEFRGYTEWVHAEFRRRGAPLLATYFCPHHPDPGNGRIGVDCACRKPAPGMLRAAMADFSIDPSKSLLIGDKPSDVEAAERAGIAGRFWIKEPNLSDALEWLPSREELRKCSM